MYAGGGRVELSGATTANWVAKSANLLVDGLGSPARVGLLLPLHWQTLVLLLAGVATGASVVVDDDPDRLADCDAVFTTLPQAQRLLDLGVGEVLALSGHPFGAALASVPGLAQDYAREVPSYADHFGGPTPSAWSIEVAGRELGEVASTGVAADARVMVGVEPSHPAGLAGLLAVLRAGASAVLVPAPGAGVDVVACAAEERATATLGLDVPGLTAL